MSQTVIQVLTDSWIAYKGKSSSMPAVGTPKYIDMLAILNRKQREWWSDPNVDWPILFQLFPSGVVSTGVQIYTVDDSVIRLSDYVMLTDSNKNITYVTVVKPPLRSQYNKGCFMSGTNPQILTFITPIDASNTGQTLTLPSYIAPDPLVNPSDVVSIADSNWGVYAVAAELARNDYSKEEQFPNLNGIANTIYQQMVDDANANSLLQPNSVPNNMPQSASLISNYGYGNYN